MRNIVLSIIMILAVGLLFADAMPDFRLPDMSGENVSLESLLGKGPILVDFWADYCQPCKVAMPYLQELSDKYEDLTVVLISMDAPKAQMRAKNYLRSKEYSFVSLFDPERSLAKRLNVSNPPHTFILDQDGEIAFSHTGFEPGTEAVYERHIRDLLGLVDEPVAEKIHCGNCTDNPEEEQEKKDDADKEPCDDCTGDCDEDHQ